MWVQYCIVTCKYVFVLSKLCYDLLTIVHWFCWWTIVHIVLHIGLVLLHIVFIVWALCLRGVAIIFVLYTKMSIFHFSSRFVVYDSICVVHAGTCTCMCIEAWAWSDGGLIIMWCDGAALLLWYLVSCGIPMSGCMSCCCWCYLWACSIGLHPWKYGCIVVHPWKCIIISCVGIVW